MTSVLIKGKLGHRDIEQHVNMKAEITAMCLEAKKHHGLPASQQKLAGRHGTDTPSQSQKKPTLPTSCPQISSYRNFETTNVYCLSTGGCELAH